MSDPNELVKKVFEELEKSGVTLSGAHKEIAAKEIVAQQQEVAKQMNDNIDRLSSMLDAYRIESRKLISASVCPDQQLFEMWTIRQLSQQNVALEQLLKVLEMTQIIRR